MASRMKRPKIVDLDAESTGSEFDEPMTASEASEEEIPEQDELEKERPKKKRRIISTHPDGPSKTMQAVQTEVVRTKRHRSGGGEKIVMTDDEDEDAYSTFRAKKENEVRRPRLSEKAKGKLPAVEKKRKLPDKSKKDKDKDDPFLVLPDYLQVRKDNMGSKNEEERTVDDLFVPPDFSDLHFPEDESLEDIEEKPAFTTTLPVAPYDDIEIDTTLGVIPAPIAQWLYSYQVDGVKMMHYAFIHQKGMILGDDMGLGKTVQVIAFLTAAFGKTGDIRDASRMRVWRKTYGDKWYPRVLVVCPLGLLNNWENEFNTWGWWQVQSYHGAHKDEAFSAALSGRLEIMLTTYDICRSSMDVLNRIPWDCVICDECHKIKEVTSATTKAMQRINALCRIGLTGTAIQNNYEEMWTLLNWCNPGFMGSLEVWKNTVSRPLKLGQSHTATQRELGNARRIARKLTNNLLPRFFLRRTKQLIEDQLPKKRDRVLFCPLTKTQAEAYKTFLESEMVQMVRNSSDPCPCGSGDKRGKCCFVSTSTGEEWKNLVFPAIQMVLSLSNHLANWIPTKEETMDVRESKERKLQMCLPNTYQTLLDRTPFENYMDTELCGKWIVLRELLKFWYAQDDGTKVLIFSYSRKHLDILRHLLAKTSYSFEILTGENTQAERTAALTRFTQDPSVFVFLISTKAGGVGLNITVANKVVIFDPNWNPSHDLQAQDRAFRMGQKRDVDVFRLISAGTVEEIVYARQIYKQQMANIGYGASAERRYFEGVMDDKTRKGELFGLKNIFTYREDVVLKNILHKTNVAEARAGFKVVDIDTSQVNNSAEADEDFLKKNPDKLISQLAGDDDDEDAIKEKPKPHPVQAILDQAGVLYAHENAEVIGTSHVENMLSKAAENQDPNPSQVDDTTVRQLLTERPIFDTAEEDEYKFRPPRKVMERQFRSMARWLGFDDLQEFALVVESWTQKERTDRLDAFYRMRRRHLEESKSPSATAALVPSLAKLEVDATAPSARPLIGSIDYARDVKSKADLTTSTPSKSHHQHPLSPHRAINPS